MLGEYIHPYIYIPLSLDNLSTEIMKVSHLGNSCVCVCVCVCVCKCVCAFVGTGCTIFPLPKSWDPVY